MSSSSCKGGLLVGSTLRQLNFLLYNSAQSLPSQSLPNFFLGPLSNFVDRGLGEWEWLGPGSTHGGRLTGPALFGAWEILGYGFQDLGSQLWGLGNFRIWFSRHGFQDLGSQLWGLDFHTRGFQDRNLKTFRT